MRRIAEGGGGGGGRVDILVMTASISSVPSAISTSARVLFAPVIVKCRFCCVRRLKEKKMCE